MLASDGPVMVPAFCCSRPFRAQKLLWTGMIVKFRHLLAACQPKATPITWEQFCGEDNSLPVGLEHEDGAQPHTKCILGVNLKKWMGQQSTFKLKYVLKNGRQPDHNTPNYAYIKVKAKGLDASLDKECYLHTLLCYMYWGAPPSAQHVAGHVCQHKCCIAPWHIRWMTNSDNIKMTHVHKKQQDYRPPKPKPPKARRPKPRACKRQR